MFPEQETIYSIYTYTHTHTSFKEQGKKNLMKAKEGINKALILTVTYRFTCFSVMKYSC